MSIIPFDPAEIIEIKVSDLSAPVAVGVELSKLYVSADAIIKRLIQDIYVDDDSGKTLIPPDLLPWYKEQRMLLSEIHKMTGEVEQKTHMKKLELQVELIKSFIKDLPQTEKIILMKRLKNTNGKIPKGI